MPNTKWLLSVLLILAAGVFTVQARADEAQTVAALTAKRAKITETKGVVAVFDLPDPTKWTDDDFKAINTLPHLQRLSFGLGVTEHQLSLLSGLDEVTAIATNGADISDAGIKNFTAFKKLATLAFFHPGKSFTGTGLADLATLPAFDNLTVGGSNTFGDDGMAAVAKLPHLKSLRVFHTNVDQAGLAKLKDNATITSLLIGQRLAYKPPLALSDETLPTLVSIKQLESLTLMESRLSAGALAQLKQLPALKHLTLDGIDIPEADVAGLKKELPNVQIKWNPPTEASMKRIKALFP